MLRGQCHRLGVLFCGWHLSGSPGKGEGGGGGQGVMGKRGGGAERCQDLHQRVKTREGGKASACLQLHGPDPAQSLCLRVSWWLWCVPLPSLVSSSSSPSPCMGLHLLCPEPHGEQAVAWVSRGHQGPPSITHSPHAPCSLLPPPPPPSHGHLSHPAPAPCTPSMSLRLQLKPVSAGERGQGKVHPVESPWRTPGTATLRHPLNHPGHREVPPAALGDKAEGIPSLWVALDALLEVVSFLFSASNLCGCPFFINPCLETKGARPTLAPAAGARCQEQVRTAGI